MFQAVTIPYWLLIVLLAIAAWVVLERLLMPSVRWFFRSRANRVIEELNRRFDIEFPQFALTKRRVLIDRLMYDPVVMEAVADYCREHGAPREYAMSRVEQYAREIVPSFNAFVYFRFGNWICKKIAATLYRMRLGYEDKEGLARVASDANVVFVMNHRSNMDYVLVAYLALYKTALSYAVGEWARVWPLQQLIRAMGAFFVRRGSGEPLYRRVLERYVQMAIEGGVTQAVYPEGRLSRDGRLQEPKLGLLDYMVKTFDPGSGRDLVFVPVGINYDRTMEDRSLLASLDPDYERPGRLRAFGKGLAFAGRNIWQMMRGKWSRFGHACANFGTPLSLREYLAERGVDFRELPREERFTEVGILADRLMGEVAKVIPVLPVSLISTVMLEHGRDGGLDAGELRGHVDALIRRLTDAGAMPYVPGRNWTYAIELGISSLTLRKVLEHEDGRYRFDPGEEPLLRYYANSIAHFLGPGQGRLENGERPAPA